MTDRQPVGFDHVDTLDWSVQADGTTMFSLGLDPARERLLNLYEKGKTRQWNASDRIDWEWQPDPDNPIGAVDSTLPIFGSRSWTKLDAAGRAHVRRQMASWQISQFLHGEQGALACAAKLVQAVPDIESRFYAATQVVDEARHTEVYLRYLREKLGVIYPMNVQLQSLVRDALVDSRWDMTYLGMQVLIEGLALAAFGLLRDHALDPLARAINAYVMQDEARHVAFGRIALRSYYPHLSEAERSEREEFCMEACLLMRRRFLAEDVWHACGLDVEECVEFMEHSKGQRLFRNLLFSRIVPTLRDIGLFGTRVQRLFEELGAIGWARADIDRMLVNDDRVAEDIDEDRRRAEVHAAVAAGVGAGAGVMGGEP